MDKETLITILRSVSISDKDYPEYIDALADRILESFKEINSRYSL